MEIQLKNKILIKLIIQNYFLITVVKISIKFHFYNQLLKYLNKKKVQQELYLIKCFLKHLYILYKIHFMDI